MQGSRTQHGGGSISRMRGQAACALAAAMRRKGTHKALAASNLSEPGVRQAWVDVQRRLGTARAKEYPAEEGVLFLGQFLKPILCKCWNIEVLHERRILYFVSPSPQIPARLIRIGHPRVQTVLIAEAPHVIAQLHSFSLAVFPGYLYHGHSELPRCKERKRPSLTCRPIARLAGKQ